MEPIKIKIAKDFSTSPGPRYEIEGEWSGEVFRKTILYPQMKSAIENGTKIIVDLDGTAGYGTSFLEEAFGGLIREEKIPFEVINNKLTLISEEETYLIDDINNYLLDAKKKVNKL